VLAGTVYTVVCTFVTPAEPASCFVVNVSAIYSRPVSTNNKITIKIKAATPDGP